MDDWVLLTVAAVALATAGVCLVVAVRTRRELVDLRRELDDRGGFETGAERPPQPPAEAGRRDGRPFVITGVSGEPRSPDQSEPPPGPEGRLFADLVLRETVVRAASLAHGVRRALAAETRHRIRFEVRREVKRARKQRKADVRTAVREWEDRQRAAQMGGEDAA